jgi:hypothetical protein
MKRKFLPLSLVIALLPFVSLVGTTNAHGWFTPGQDAPILSSGFASKFTFTHLAEIAISGSLASYGRSPISTLKEKVVKIPGIPS